MTKELALFQDYTREEIHDIFAPETLFTRGSGSWGAIGIIEIRGQDGDFVFIVSYGQKQGDHVFKESVTEDGVLTWQSQPNQTLANRQIQKLINHDETKNTIYLFLRTSKRTVNTYLGNLKYLDHDPNLERPVHFLWQIIDWQKPPREVLERIKLTLEEGKNAVVSPPADRKLTIVPILLPLPSADQEPISRTRPLIIRNAMR